MRNTNRLVRLVVRAVAIGLVVVGAVLVSSWFEVLMEATVDASSGGGPATSGGSAEALGTLPWAVPALLVGLALLVVTTKRERYVSLMRRADDV